MLYKCQSGLTGIIIIMIVIIRIRIIIIRTIITRIIMIKVIIRMSNITVRIIIRVRISIIRIIVILIVVLKKKGGPKSVLQGYHTAQPPEESLVQGAGKKAPADC